MFPVPFDSRVLHPNSLTNVETHEHPRTMSIIFREVVGSFFCLKLAAFSATAGYEQ